MGGEEREEGNVGRVPRAGKPQALSDWWPRTGPAPSLTLHIRLRPGHLLAALEPLLLPWCLCRGRRMEQDPKLPRLRLWGRLSWLPRKQRPRVSQTSVPATGLGSGPRQGSVSVSKYRVKAVWGP